MMGWVATPFILITAFVFHLVDAANIGQWGPLIQFPLVPVAGVILGNGSLLVWSAFGVDTFGVGISDQTQTAIYNPATGTVVRTLIVNTKHNMFCPGISMDQNGRVVVTGGDSTFKTTIYSPTDQQWITAAPMTVGRGYQSSTTCSDGRIFTIGGSYSGGRGGKNGEIYNPTANTWTALPGAVVAPMLTADSQGVYRSDNHAWLFGWKNGAVFQAGPSKAMNWYTTAGTGGQSSAGIRDTIGDSMNGNAVMYDAVAGKIFTAGGAPDYSDVNRPTTGHFRAHVITIGAPGTTASVLAINRMWFARGFHNSVVLPDGKVLILGGQSRVLVFTDTDATLTPELWDPATTNFIKMKPSPTPRTYHSIAILMPDGSVFSGGGGLCYSSCSATAINHFNGEFFYPPYLFLADGVTRAPRPTISALSTKTIRVGGSIAVTVASAVASFSIIRLGSVTHSINTDQRRIPLTHTANGLVYTITVPNDSGVTLPGYWMLFAINANGVPSESKIILITL